jgi:tetratricopeptide (TPR) repeat protein
MGDFAEKLAGIQKSWNTWVGLLAAEAVIPAIALFIKKFEVPTLINLIVCVVIALGIFIVWYLTNALPKTNKNKIGFVVSISCDDEQNHKIIRDDFIITLRKLITSGKSGKFFQFIEVPRHISSKVIDTDDAQKLRVKTRAHFVLYGRSRTRPINSKEVNYIELDGIVAHNPIPTEVQTKLSSEFSELLPRKIAIDKENGIFAFELTSEWTELVAKYIIAIAATVSGDLDYAELLYSEVQSKLLVSNRNITAFSKLNERIPVRLAEIHEAKATYCLNKWFMSYDMQLIEQMNIEISKIKLRNVSIGTTFMRAFCSFLINRNVNEAISYIKSCPKSCRDAVWHFNLAFLEAYKGNLKRAMQHYRNTSKLNITIETINQLESFITYVINEEPEQAQLYFCLGYINWNLKGDNLQAIKDYNEFISQADECKFPDAIFYAKKWVCELLASESEVA